MVNNLAIKILIKQRLQVHTIIKKIATQVFFSKNYFILNNKNIKYF